MTNKEYSQMTKKASDKSNVLKDCICAFIVGGLICTLGQFLTEFYAMMGISLKMSQSFCSITLVTLAIILTGLNIYPKMSKFAGAGTLVPITGFANAMASAAIEFKTEGQVLGTGGNMFKIAGPVIVYGLVASFVYGIIVFIFGIY